MAPASVLAWHGGTPHTGRALPPVEALAAAGGRELLVAVRPGYGGTAPRPGRSVADAARDVAARLEAEGLRKVLVVGYSGGGPHALALAALAPDHVAEVVAVASPAPYDGTDAWFAGMQAPGDLQAAARGGRPARAQRPDLFDPEQFVAGDWVALEGAWASIGEDAEAAGATARDAIVDDDVALTRPWGVDLAQIRAPVRLLHGTEDRVIPLHHGERLLALLPHATLDRRAGAGHVAVLEALAG